MTPCGLTMPDGFVVGTCEKNDVIRVAGAPHFGLSRLCDREAAHHVVALDQARDKPRFLRLLDKVVQESGASGVLACGTDGLLDRAELPVENSRSRQFLDIFEQAGPQTSQRVQLFVDELLEGGVATL